MPVGRPLKFESVEQLQSQIDSYFTNTPKDEWTITGLAMALDTSRQVLCDYEDKRPKYSNILKEARLKIKSQNNKARFNYTKGITALGRIKYRYKNDPDFRFRMALASNIRNCIKRGRGGKFDEFLLNEFGYSLGELKNWLEMKFKEGMNWSNYGKWHIDHIKPIVLYEDKKSAWSLDNLQPLWAIDNIRKGCKYLYS
jgi:hypothetical protein